MLTLTHLPSNVIYLTPLHQSLMGCLTLLHNSFWSLSNPCSQFLPLEFSNFNHRLVKCPSRARYIKAQLFTESTPSLNQPMNQMKNALRYIAKQNQEVIFLQYYSYYDNDTT